MREDHSRPVLTQPEKLLRAKRLSISPAGPCHIGWISLVTPMTESVPQALAILPQETSQTFSAPSAPQVLLDAMPRPSNGTPVQRIALWARWRPTCYSPAPGKPPNHRDTHAGSL